MKDHETVELNAPPSEAEPAENQSDPPRSAKPQDPMRSISQWLIRDWQTHKYFFFGILLLLLTTFVTVIYYVNYPQPQTGPDTPSYLAVTYKLNAHPTWLVDVFRLPGYPLFIDFIYKLTWENNLVAVGIAQAVLFVLATMEIYILAILVLKRTWMAFLIGLIVGTNIILISYIKPIMTEGLSLWLVSTLALAVVYYVRTQRIRAFWLIVLCLIALIFTRPEWVYFPVPLFAYLLLVALRRAAARRFLLNALLGLACIYGLVAAYIGVNAQMNQFPGITSVENFNWLGKILQFNMQDEAPPQYAQYSHQIDIINAHRNRSPYFVLGLMPSLAKDHAQPAGEYARAIILNHPVEFFVDSIPTFLPSLTHYYDDQPVEPNAPFHVPISLLLSFNRLLYRANAFFLLCIPLWLFLLCWRKIRSHPLVLEMGAIVLLAFYALTITDLGGYKYEDYMRVHIVFDALLIFAVWGSLFLGVQLLYGRVVRYWQK